jgi:hypothetical protein
MMIFLYEFDLLLLLPKVCAFTPGGHQKCKCFFGSGGHIIAKPSPALPTGKTVPMNRDKRWRKGGVTACSAPTYQL